MTGATPTPAEQEIIDALRVNYRGFEPRPEPSDITFLMSARRVLRSVARGWCAGDYSYLRQQEGHEVMHRLHAQGRPFIQIITMLDEDRVCIHTPPFDFTYRTVWASAGIGFELPDFTDKVREAGYTVTQSWRAGDLLMIVCIPKREAQAVATLVADHYEIARRGPLT